MECLFCISLLELLTHFVAGLLFLLPFSLFLTILLGDSTISSFLPLILSLIPRLLYVLVLSSLVCLGHILMHNIPSIKLWLNAECARTWQLSGWRGRGSQFDFDTRCRCGVIWIIIRATNMAISSSFCRCCRKGCHWTWDGTDKISKPPPPQYSSWQRKGAKTQTINSFLEMSLNLQNF